MVRKLLKSLLSLSLIAPLSAFALGLGDIHLHSALSERLKADIDLLSVNAAEADAISVSLASQDSFNKVGLERPAVLMFLQFEVVKTPSGDYSINVTSREPINEPFLDFLIEVDWKSGRVLREYTLLLDPPSSYREAAPAVTAPKAAMPVAPAPKAAPGSVVSLSKTEAKRAMEAAPSQSAPQQGAPRTTTMDAAPVSSEGLVYGPVKADDTLWAIALKMRPNKNISVQQMMVALVKANPYAFFDGNINRLKRGYVLRIDDQALLTAMSKAEAAREVSRQTRAWQDYRQSVAARAKQRPADASAVEAMPGAAVATKSEPKLTLVAPEGKAADSAKPSGTGKTSEEVSEELMLALESAAAQRKENEDLKGRLEALEGQLQDMEKIISLKDADLAALQQQMKTQGQAVDLPSEKMAAEEASKLVEKGEEPAPAAEPVKEVAKPEVKEAAKAEAKPAPAQEKPAKAAPKEKKPVAKKPKKVAPPPPPEPTMVDMLMDNMMYIGGGLVLILLLGMLALIIKRRRSSGFQESILSGGTSSMMKASDDQGSETSFLSDLAISGMGPGNIQTDEGEVDPLTEADVFMAYGRNQQAEEVLKKAREKSPERADVAAKLLEVYYNAKDKEKFETLADEAVGSLQGDDALWGKVLAMGHELCPDNVLFEAGAGAEMPVTEAPEPAEAAAADTVMDIGLDLDELTAEMEGEGSEGMDLDLGLDFSDLEDDDENGEEALTSEADELGLDELGAEEQPGAEASDMDLDLGDLDIDLGTEESAEETADDLDFDLDLGEEESPAEDTSADDLSLDLDLSAEPEEGAEGADAAELEFDLDLGEEAGDEMELDLGELSTEAESEPTMESAEEPELDMALDLGDLAAEAAEEAGNVSLDLDMDDFDLGDLDELGGAEEAAESLTEAASLDDDLGDFGDLDLGDLDSELGDLDAELGELGDLDVGGDEMATKLDLAQAYAEMGDAEGARSMLEEVVAAGNDEQKQQAQALIDKL